MIVKLEISKRYVSDILQIAHLLEGELPSLVSKDKKREFPSLIGKNKEE
jgi:hypothetical protein